jgi:adenine-specific DNA methylase
MAAGGFGPQMDAVGLGRIHRAYRKFLREQAAVKAAQEQGPPLDCFAGSGQIPLAVKRVGGGRRCVAVEINPRYCEVAERRLREGRP